METGSLNQVQIARLLMQHRVPLYGYIFACVRNHADAEDILQSVSMVVAESFQQLKSEDGFMAWAREIARRRVLAHQRQQSREVTLDPELIQRLADAAAEAERIHESSVRRAALLACLETLAPEHRRIIAMRYDGSSTAEDLAAACGRSVQSVYALVKRIKQALRVCVERRLCLEGEA